MPTVRNVRRNPPVSVLVGVIGWGLLVYALMAPALAAQPKPTEDQIKGAYLLNFAQLVTWPPESHGSPDDPPSSGSRTATPS
jgi:hypothetical protein